MAKTATLYAPITGKAIDITEVADPTFAKKMIGDGFGIQPTDTKVVAPVTGSVELVAGTKHAIGFRTDDGMEVLVHLGIDTVEMNGAPFTISIKEGDAVTEGQPIGTMDIDMIKKAGKSTDVMTVITNTKDVVDKLEAKQGDVTAGEAVATVTLKDAMAAATDEKVSTKPKKGEGKYDELAKQIVKDVGGPENVSSVIHCITRVRFYLKDDNKANDDAIKNLDGVIDVAKAGGQYQVVIGPGVADVYDAVVKQLGPGFGDQSQQAAAPKRKAPKGFFPKIGFYLSSLIGVITASMMPIIGLLAAAGILKGFLSLATSFKWISATSTTYTIINAMGDATFYFLPILVGFTAAKRLGANQIIVAVIGGVLAYPTIIKLSATTGNIVFGVGMNATFFGIPLHVASYTYSIFPMIAAAWMASVLEPWLKKHISASVSMIVNPLLEVFLVSAAVLIIVGPVISLISAGIADGLVAVYKASPAISGLIIGGFYQCLVIFGLHWAVIPIVASQIATTGHSMINAIISATMVAQSGAVLAVFFKTHDQKLKQLAGASTLSAFSGITEPAMYGINLKYGKCFVTASIGGAVGGFLTGLLHVNMWGFAGSFIGFASFINPKGLDSSFWGFWIASLSALAVSFVLTWMFGFNESKAGNSHKGVKKVRLGSREPAIK
ncbi:beta-glucosides PTS, EIIABC [Lactobacillus selangorensis]|uniref:PTS system sucrose-specific EIIBCA component n=1 Tax=Lactobacillus selangorensis TaxID=81857 RepID=A0A0R2FUU2_9LACO|nr:glucose PTS transporter subunit IIA [Lactobacillus selangorensis]KRN29255.1 beta-glucosides PTS, EIIABC [Lactobacillus selangorensis]KRN29787.1 beta-glucosides PTS, EIIABC [Lactobacillus selangorensis]